MAKTTCPHCGQPLKERFVREGVKLTRTTARILDLVTAKPGLTLAEIADELGVATETAKAHIYHMNERLRPYGYTVQGAKGWGYRVYSKPKRAA